MSGKTGWRHISVEQPSPLQDVLVTAVDDEGRTVYMLALSRGGQWLWSGDGERFDCGRVIGWQPLPEPMR